MSELDGNPCILDSCDVESQGNGDQDITILRAFTVGNLKTSFNKEAEMVVKNTPVALGGCPEWSTHPFYAEDAIGDKGWMKSCGYSVKAREGHTALVVVRYQNIGAKNIIGSDFASQQYQTDRNMYGDRIIVSNIGMPKKTQYQASDITNAAVNHYRSNDYIEKAGVIVASRAVQSFTIEMVLPNGSVHGPDWNGVNRPYKRTLNERNQIPLNYHYAYDPQWVGSRYNNKINSERWFLVPSTRNGTELNHVFLKGEVKLSNIRVDPTGFSGLAYKYYFTFDVLYKQFSNLTPEEADALPSPWHAEVAWTNKSGEVAPGLLESIYLDDRLGTNYGYPQQYINGVAVPNWSTTGSYGNAPAGRFFSKRHEAVDFNEIFATDWI